MATKSMNSTHQQIIDTLDAFKLHPIVSFVTGIATMLIMSLTGDIYSWHIPDFLMQCGQVVAWTFVAITGLITLIGFLEKFFDMKINYKSILAWLKSKKKKHGNR